MDGRRRTGVGPVTGLSHPVIATDELMTVEVERLVVGLV